MTRRSGSSRATRSGQNDPAGEGRAGYPSLRQRNPIAYWMAILAVLAMVLSTIAAALGAIL